MGNNVDIEERLQYKFKSYSVIEEALSHSSYINEAQFAPIKSNERLEFLGDAVLELVITEFIFNKYPELLEGQLTRLRSSIVCEAMLAKKAKALKLGEDARMGRGEEQTGGRDRGSILSDLFEAVIGAIYLDGGFDTAKNFILRQLEQDIVYMRSCFMHNDAKSYLQEILQKNGKVNIEYKVVSETGPEHAKTFSVKIICNRNILGRGEGKSKKEAEQNAAANAIEKLERQPYRPV